MKSVPAQLQAHIEEECTSLAFIWRVRRTDGQEFFFTAHDRDIEFEGNVYESAVGFNATTIDTKAGLSVDNLDVLGIITSESITTNDLRAGKFDYAEVFIGIVNWKDPTQGQIRQRRGRIGEAVYSEVTEFFNAELRGMVQQLAQQTLEVYDPECRANLGDKRCKVPLLLDDWEAEASFSVGDLVRFPVADSVVTVPFINPSFEDDAPGTTAITGWTSVGPGTPIIATGSLGAIPGAKDGSNYVIGNGGTQESCSVEQTVDITGLFTNEQLDSGRLYPYMQVWRINAFSQDRVRGRFQFLDATDTLISELVSDLPNFSGGAWDDLRLGWKPTNNFSMPIGTRKLKVVLEMVQSLANNESAFDDVEVFVRDRTVTGDVALLGDVYYECTQGGTSSDHIPPFTDVVDDVIVEDGRVPEVEWVVRNAFLRQAVVASVTDRLNFTITVDEPRDVDGWFAYGAVIFESGENIGEAMEVKRWTQTGSIVELFLEMPFDIAIGDRLVIYAGCDKRLATCISKFNNVVNFRGEPFVPGQRQLLDYPDAR